MKTKTLLISTFAVFTLLMTLSYNQLNANDNALNKFEKLGLYLDEHEQDYGKYGKDSARCVRNLSIYIEYYRQRSLEHAVEPWRWVYHNCPGARQNTFIHGAQIIKYLYSIEEDPQQREAYVDSLMTLYDKRIKYFGREGFVLGRKAADLYTFQPNNVMEIYEISERSISLEGKSSSADVLLIHFHSLISLVQAGLKEEYEVLEAYDRAMNIIDHVMETEPDKRNQYEVTKGNLEQMFSPFASCENIVQLYQPRFENNPNDPELLQKITEMLDNSDCHDEELFYNASLNLYNLAPNAEAAFMLGRMEQENENFDKALKFFKEAIPLYEKEEDKFTPYLIIADILFRQFDRYSDARRYALKAADAQPDNGRPFLLIGEMYGATARQCGDNEFTERVAHWAAVDKFKQAKRVDDSASIQERADSMIDTHKRHFPTRENIFFYVFEEGETYTVECWINERTIIRAR